MRLEYERYFSAITDFDLFDGRFRGFRRTENSGPFARGSYYPRALIFEIFDLIPANWRSDARFFLAINMIEMVLEPYSKVSGRPAALMMDGDVWPLIAADIKLIVHRSEQVARTRDRKYVSATSVAIALGQEVENLKTTSLQIWGPGDGED